MSFKEIRDKLIEMDNQAIADWEARANDWMRCPPSLEERLSFVEYRRSVLAGGVGAILSELIAREEHDTEAPNTDVTGPCADTQGTRNDAAYCARSAWTAGLCSIFTKENEDGKQQRNCDKTARILRNPRQTERVAD